jgi:TRAP-type C4-dicarboxylate transport system permease small subunit
MQRILDRIALVCGWLAGLSVLAMTGLTVADVVLRAFFNRPIHGVYELVELLLAGAIFSALPAAFLRDENIVVDLADHSWPRAVPVLRRVAAVVSFVVVAAMGWCMIPRALDIMEFGDVTPDLALPRIWYWIPVLAGVFGAAAAALVAMLRTDRR